MKTNLTITQWLALLALAALLTAASASRAAVMYVSNGGNHSIEMFDLATGTDLGAFATTNLACPWGMAFDSTGDLYVANLDWSQIAKFTPAGVGSVFVGTGLDEPTSLLLDSEGNLVVANFEGNTIFKYTPGGVGSVFASSGLHWPTGLAFDTAGNLYAANYLDNNIVKFTPAGAGSVFASTYLSNPECLAFDGAGNLYAANHSGNTIVKFTPGGVGSVFASSGLNQPEGLAFDSEGNLYVANLAGNSIMKFTPGGVGSVFATSGLNRPQFIVIQTRPQLHPTISTNPASTTVFVGSTVTLNVTASGGNLSYQWSFNGTNIAGATNATLTISNCCSANAGSYVVTVSNAAGSATSPSAILKVLPIVANGDFETGTLTNWSLSGNTAYLSVSAKSYYVHSGSYGVQAGPVGALGYLSQTLATVPGQPYLLSLWLDSPDAATPNEFTVSWNGTTLFDGVNLGAIGWTNVQFVVGAMSASSLIQIGVRNDPSYFGLDDVSVTPIFSVTPLITLQPASQTLPIGDTASFNVTAIGTPPLAYQWYFNTNTPVSGATNAALVFGPVTTNQAGYYQVIVTNLYGSATSSLAALTVQLVLNIYCLSNCASGAKTLYLASIPGSTNRLWASTNLIQWQVVATNSADSNGFFQITDTNAIGYRTMFYRLSWP